MNNGLIIREFEALAERLGIHLRTTASGPSGMCRVKGKLVFFFERGLSSDERVNLFIREFSRLDLDAVYVVPLIRELIDMKPDSDWD